MRRKPGARRKLQALPDCNPKRSRIKRQKCHAKSERRRLRATAPSREFDSEMVLAIMAAIPRLRCSPTDWQLRIRSSTRGKSLLAGQSTKKYEQEKRTLTASRACWGVRRLRTRSVKADAVNPACESPHTCQADPLPPSRCGRRPPRKPAGPIKVASNRDRSDSRATESFQGGEATVDADHARYAPKAIASGARERANPSMMQES